MCRHPIRIALVLAVAASLTTGCALLELFGGGVKLDTDIEGTLEYSDEHSDDSNYYTFYWDWYEIRLDADKSYTLELWTDPDCPVHWECDQLGEDLGGWSDGDGTWDGYLLYEIPAFSGKLGFDFYVRADYVGAASWYRFRINEM